MFERSNVAADHQQLLMTTLKRVAQKHGMECLFHEKPFEGINGSGKHVNFSLGNSTEGNLLLPGRHPSRQRPVPGVLRGGDPGRAQVRRPAAGVGGIGQQRPPPGRQRGAAGHHLHLPRRAAGRRVRPDRQGRRQQLEEEGHLSIGVDTLPVLPTDPGDRNRTSPFAFTGNRFEFRAPGSLQSIAGPMVTINTILAEALDYIATELEALMAGGTDFNDAVQKVLEEIITDPRQRGLQRRRLHRRLADRGGGARPAQPAHHARRPPAADLRRVHGAVQPIRGLQPPGDAQPLRDRPGAVHPQHRRRGPLDCWRWRTRDPAGRPALPDRAGDQRGQPEGHRHRDRTRARSTRCPSSIEALQRRNRRAARRDRPRSRRDQRRSRPSHIQAETCRRWLPVRAAADELEGLVADDLWPLATYQEMLFIL